MKQGQLALLAALATLANGHARLVRPLGRSSVNHGSNESGANGESPCGGGTGSQWSTDASWTDSLDWPIQGQYDAGASMEVGLVFSAPHVGHFRVELCDPSSTGGVITEGCFKALPRDSLDTKWSAFLVNYPFDFFIPDNTCTMGFTVDQPLTGRFRLPPNYQCAHCVIRVYWQTGNSCLNHPADCGCAYWGCPAPDPRLASWSNDLCRTGLSPVSNPCGENCPKPNCEYEQFKICADITIGSPSTASTTSSTTPASVVSTEPSVSSTTSTASADAIAYCQQHLEADYDSWTAECIRGCSEYTEWCSQRGLVSGPDLVDCMLMINGTCREI